MKINDAAGFFENLNFKYMANCKKYLSLTDDEQKMYIGELVHAVMTDPVCFEAGKEIIELGKEKGNFDNVKIGHEEIYQDKEIID